VTVSLAQVRSWVHKRSLKSRGNRVCYCSAQTALKRQRSQLPLGACMGVAKNAKAFSRS
jgi:hypothetical protein